jgi:type IV pilus assembly protein PilP
MILSKWWLALALTAQDPAAAPTEQTPAEASPAPLAAEAQTEVSYTYNPFGKRDPFRSFMMDRSEKQDQSEDPLLNYDLAKFSLTGIIWGVANPKAIVRDGGGRGHIISRGTRIGRNRGRVTRILKSEVVIAEEFRDPLGKLLVSEYRMKLEELGKSK